jgi:hypothetical protein
LTRDAIVKLLLLILAAVALVTAGGFALCTVTGLNPHPRPMIAAAVTSVIVSMLSALPLVWTRNGSQATIAQAALAVTVIHLFAHAVAAGVAIVARTNAAYVYWLMPLYWATLAALVVVLVRVVRSAPIAEGSR